MANSDKNILITPNIGAATGTQPTITFTGADNVPISIKALDTATLSFDGSAGQLFSITNSLTGTLFSVNDISGIPSIEVLDTGLIKMAQYNGSVTITNVTDGSIATATRGAGYMGMPQVSIAGSLTLNATHAGKHIYVTVTGQTITIPANSATAFPIGTTIVVVNAPSVSTSIAITTDTLRLANSTSTGTRTLAASGMCTLLKIASTVWIASGNGLT